MKRLIPIIVILAAILLTGCSAGDVEKEEVSSIQQLEGDELYRRNGELFVVQAREESCPTGDIAVKALNYQISFAYLNSLVEENVLSGMSESVAENFSLNKVIMTRSLYYYAINSGFGVPETEIQGAHSVNAAAAEAKEGESFASFIEGTGVSAEEYWNMYYPQFKITYVNKQYKIYLYEQFEAETAAEQQTDEAWRSYLTNVVRQAVEAQQLEFGEGITWEFNENNSYLLAMQYV